MRSVPQALGTPSVPQPSLSMGPGAAGAVEWGGCSPFQVSPRRREPQGFLNLVGGGVACCLGGGRNCWS